MRATTICCLSALLFFGTLRAAAQEEWTDYTSIRDGFQAQFPGQPRVVETTWKSQAGFTLPSRIYSVDRGREHYSVTVADYSNIPALGKERIRTCTTVDEICVGSSLSGEGFWKHDTRGAMLYATASLLKRDVKVLDLAWNQIARVQTYVLTLRNNSDESTTYAAVVMHEMMLYIVEGTRPKGSPSPVQFAGSFQVLAKGSDRPPNYGDQLYVHEVHGLRQTPPPPPSPPGSRGPVLYNLDGTPSR